jgi:hypothetical protein
VTVRFLVSYGARKMVAHRIADPAILKLIGKWLKAGAMVDGARDSPLDIVK